MYNNFNKEEKERIREILDFFIVCNDVDFKAFIEQEPMTPSSYFGILFTFKKINSFYLKKAFLHKHKNFIRNSIEQEKHPCINKNSSSYKQG